MRHTAYSGPLFLAVILSALTPSSNAHAQSPAAGTSVSVKMVEAVDSSIDSAGKQYRASVTKAVDAGNGLTIPQGAIAAVTLSKGGTGWTTQLASVTINGQVVPVASGSASVTSNAQSAAGSAINSVSSVLGGFGHHVNPPPAVAAVATGQRVVLPPGVTLTFVLTAPPANTAGPSPSPSTPAGPPTAQPSIQASAAAAPSAAASSASGPAVSANGRYVFCFTGQGANLPTNSHTSATEPITYFSDVFPEPAIGLHVNVDWNDFLKNKPSTPLGACQDAIGLSAAQTRKQQREDEMRREGKTVVETAWKFNPAGDSAPGQASAPAPATANTAYYKECAALFGDRANEHCGSAANEYYAFCQGSADSSAPEAPSYFSDVFAFNKNGSSVNVSAALAPSFLLFLETKYGLKVSNDFYPTSHYTGGSYPTGCLGGFPSLSWAQHQKQGSEDGVVKSRHKQIIETGWKTSIAPLPPVTAPPAAANEHYVFCYSDKALLVQYFSEIFAAVPPAGDSIANAFFASLQKKYGFNDPRPGPPVTCEVSPKPANAFMFQTEWSVRQNMESTGDVGKKAIETGWKYTP